MLMTAGSVAETLPETMVFTRVEEPKEKAFSILIPKGWQTEGGIFRIDPTQQGGAAQSIAAKLDFIIKSDAGGKVMIRALPDVLFFDMSNAPAGQMGLFPPGSNYQGMTVMPKLPASHFIPQIVIPYAHPRLSDYTVTDQRQLPDVASYMQQQSRKIAPQMTMSYDAAVTTISYTEGGVEYTEKIIAVVEDWGQLGAGLWGNKETALVRAPKDQFSQWEPVFDIIRKSIVLNQTWVIGEIRGQMERANTYRNVQQDIQRIGREIAEHQRITNSEINNDMFLTLTGQEEYVNPYTNEVEIGNDHWKNRWVNESGDVIYSDNDSYDPNTDINLNRSDYKRSPVRPRGPQ